MTPEPGRLPNLAVVDIGSNAIRLLVSRVLMGGQLETLASLRLPVRLGQDVFATGRLSEPAMQMAVEAFRHFQRVTASLEVGRRRVAATSAMREAVNRAQLVERVASQTGFAIEIISAQEEACLVHLAVQEALDLRGKTSLLIDIGGGSVDLALADGGAILATQSLPLGTVRMLNAGQGAAPSLTAVVGEHTAAVQRFLQAGPETRRVEVCVGTGGNIEEMGKLRRRLLRQRSADLLTLVDLNRLVDVLSPLSVAERIRKLGLNPDRADVILPAALVLQMIAVEAKAREVLIPFVGLREGLMLEMARQLKEETGRA
jgi:exopolyphosphatase / guanosine-5'-triphosphate,3'-diphosphate pyrophosphatase